MADKVKPLKIENSATGGTQIDPFPTEANPSQDYLAAKGIAFENNDNRLIDLDGSGNIQFKDFTETVYWPLWKLKRAIYHIFDPTGTDLISTNSEDAIKEIRNKVSTSASPGFSYGASGTVTAGSYLKCESVPSNISGRWVYITNAVVRKVFVSNENTNIVLRAYYHDGNGVNLTLLGSVTLSSPNVGGAFSVNWSVPIDKQIALQVFSGSAKNIVAGLELSGTS